MRTIDKILYKVNCKFGAPCGRLNEGKRPSNKIIYDCRVRLDSGGYDKGGAYWGIGDELRVSYTSKMDYIEFYRVEKKREVIEFIIPTWAGSYFINGDTDCLNDEELILLEKFEKKCIKNYGNANLCLPSSPDELNLGFCARNDVENMACDCIRLLLLPSK